MHDGGSIRGQLYTDGAAAWKVSGARNQVLDGIRQVSVALKEGRIRICSTCRDAIREFGLYRWAEGKPGDVPVKENDHAMDDIRYFVSTLLPLEKEDTGAPVLTVERGGYFAERED